MTRKEMYNYKKFHRGLHFSFYEPIVDGINLLTDMPKNYAKKLDWVDCTVFARSVNPNNPLLENDMRNIDEELAMMDSKYRILKDHLKHTDNKRLIHEKQPRETWTAHTVLEDHPYFDGANDHWRSKMQDVHEQTIPTEEIRNAEKRWEKRSALFRRNKVKDVQYSTELNFEGIKTRRPLATLKIGKI